MPEKSGTGVIVGRFQTYKLNAEHQRLIDIVVARHRRVVIFLGSNPAPSEVNPLDFKWRRELFSERYSGKVEVLEVPDAPDDRIWSQELDRRILELRPEGEVILYGTAAGLYNRDGKITGAIESIRDISERKNLEITFLKGLKVIKHT